MQMRRSNFPSPHSHSRRSSSLFTERAYEQLRDAIASLVLQPGQQLTEVSIAEWLKLGRTPVREALLRLRNEGLIESVPRKGYYVSTLSAGEAQEIYEMLEGLEGMAVKLAAERATPDDLVCLERAICRMEEALANNDPMAWASSDAEVHATILDIARNRRIKRVVESINVRVKRLQMFTIRMGRDRTHSTRSHRQQFEAIRAGDGLRAREIRQELWAKARAELVEIVRNFADPEGSE